MTCPHGSPVDTPCLECAADEARGYCSRCHGAPHRTGACVPPTVTVEPLVLDEYVCSLCGQALSVGRPHICHMTVTIPSACGCPTDSGGTKIHVMTCPFVYRDQKHVAVHCVNPS